LTRVGLLHFPSQPTHSIPLLACLVCLKGKEKMF